MGFLKTNCGSDPRIKALVEKSAFDTPLSTNEKLTLLGILPDDDEVAAAVSRNYDLQADLKPEQVPLTLHVAKELRTCFAHRFGQPSDKLVAIIKSSRFEDFPIRLTADGYEVTLVLSRMIAEVIQVMVYLINQKAVQNYGTL